MNYPPFYSGQKVANLSLSVNGIFLKDAVYTVHECFQCESCKRWHVTVRELTGNGAYTCNCAIRIKSTNNHYGRESKHFVPIISKFEEITFEKVLEKELVSQN